MSGSELHEDVHEGRGYLTPRVCFSVSIQILTGYSPSSRSWHSKRRRKAYKQTSWPWRFNVMYDVHARTDWHRHQRREKPRIPFHVNQFEDPIPTLFKKILSILEENSLNDGKQWGLLEMYSLERGWGGMCLCVLGVGRRGLTFPRHRTCTTMNGHLPGWKRNAEKWTDSNPKQTKTLALRPTLPAVLHANRKSRSGGQASTGHWKEQPTSLSRSAAICHGDQTRGHRKKPGDGSQARRQTPPGRWGRGSNASSLYSAMVLGRRQGLGPGTRKRWVTGGHHHCAFIFWGNHIKGEKTRKKEGARHNCIETSQRPEATATSSLLLLQHWVKWKC